MGITHAAYELVDAAYNTTFPSVEELWERGGADVVDGIPDFNVEVVGDPKILDETELYRWEGLKRRKIGAVTLLRYDTSDGIDRLVSMRRLYDQYRSEADFITTTSTAWTTTVNGYAGRRDRRIALEAGIQTVSIGAEGSTNQQHLTRSMREGISLARSAQSEQAILARLSKDFDLSTQHYGLGDSRGGMLKPGHSIYAPMYGNTMLFTDIKAPCVPDKLNVKDLPKVALWLATEALGTLSVTASLARDSDLGVLLNTFDANPQAMKVALLGIIPELMSGERGRLAEAAPDDMNGHTVLYGHDILSPADRWLEIYSHKPDMFMKDVPEGRHAHLVTKIGLQIARIMRAEELLATNQAFDDGYVIRGIRSRTKKQADLQLVVNQ